ncbi:MAG: hypothetical protein IH933_01280 [Euryarchaeota archaeon]|jgi:hypothetical protein|nr:hypothetical protein [Euryarchaeota archaeon]
MILSGALDLVYDDTLRFRFTVTNTGDDPIELRFRDGQSVDFVVLENGRERWRWSDGRLFTQAIRSERLGPNESSTHEGMWSGPESGRYTVCATLCAKNHDCSVERTVSLSGETLSFDPS